MKSRMLKMMNEKNNDEDEAIFYVDCWTWKFPANKLSPVLGWVSDRNQSRVERSSDEL